MPTVAAGPCVSCAQHRAQSLVRLGISTDKSDYLIALAGNPNVGKSTVFNELTGLRQHTGNWPGKTVVRAEGAFVHEGKRAKVVDLPGTYSLLAGSVDEEVARDFVLFGRPDVTVVVVDATRLERNLNLVLQVLEITDRVVVFLNLVDEARRHGIAVDPAKLERELGVPVVQGIAREGVGIDNLISAVHEVALGTHSGSAIRVEQHTAEVEVALDELVPVIQDAFPEVPNARWVALRLLNADEAVEGAVQSGELGQLSHDESGALVEIAPAEARHRVLKKGMSLRWSLPSDFQDVVTGRAYEVAEQIAARVQVRGLKKVGLAFDRKMDEWLTSRIFGFPLMLFILATVFWITIEGANIPSSLLATALIDNGHSALKALSLGIGIPWWLDGLLLDGVYLATAWVVAVMLPPMAIFFPLFTLLEDFGYLPRVAFNLDSLFRKAGAHGKQALTMCMGFGCNAAGVVATRVIDSPRERLIAIITNNFSLCNGRWPTQILIATIFIGALAPSQLGGLISAGAVVGIALLGIVMMFLSSWILSRTVLRGEATSFSLELPPYRPPQVWQTLYTSIIDRTLIVLWRAVIFAIPAGALIWLISNINLNGVSLAHHAVDWLDPAGLILGMNGVILVAYVVAIPANEIVIPTVLMLTVLTGGFAMGEGAGVMFELDSVGATGDLLRAGGWTLLTGVNLMLFSLLHNPCSTTIYTIYKETRSTKWTAVATLMPLAMGLTVCFLVAQVWRLAAG
ncbi:MAG: ferrous iron transport protein B [Gemmatimonadota bacterium]|nr:ferrous iron transport protein B [Gemmatimonadota bacterium]MEE3136531.1 ferrous iron transport protein B [Gemmatimonadota bacterium]